MITATKQRGLHTLVPSLAVLLAFASAGAAQQRPILLPPGLFMGMLLNWGSIVSIQGSQALAAAAPTRRGGWGGPLSKTKAAGYKQVQFQIPPGLPQQPRPGQTVYLSSDGQTVGIVKFAIHVPNLDECLGRGLAQGCFIMRTSDITVSNTGIVTGVTQVQSDDAIEGFQGNVAVRLLDPDGNDLVPVLQVGCWGVNMRSGRTEPWSVTAAPDLVVKTREVKVYQYKSGCGDKAADFFRYLKAAGDALGPIITAVATAAK